MSADDYAAIRSSYGQALQGIMSEYLRTDGARVTRFRNMFKQAVVQAFPDTFDGGWEEGGGELPIDPEANSWLVDRQTQEWGYVDDLFAHLRDDIKKGGDPSQFDGEIADRVEGYCSTLDGVRSTATAMGKLSTGADPLVQFLGNSGRESCQTCVNMLGKWYKLSWVLDNDMLVYPGNENYICNGYKCQHYWRDAKGKIYTT